MSLWRELVLVLVGAIAGAVVTASTEAFSSKHPHWIVLIATVLLLGALGALALRSIGPLKLIFARRTSHDLKGTWNGRFEYDKNSEPVVVRELLELTQHGAFVKGRSHSTSVAGAFPLSAATYTFDATLRADGVLEGRWTNTEVAAYYGLLQGKVNRSAQIITGTWMGVDNDKVNKGEFLWSRGPIV